MTKFFTKMIALFVAVLTSQGLLAQNNVVFEESFANGLGEFTVEGFTGNEANPIWEALGDCAQADAYCKAEQPVKSYLVSPVFTMASTANVVSFDYAAFYMGSKIEKEMMLSVREEGGEWEDFTLPVCMQTSEFISSGYIKIPSSYNGKKAQVAFKYDIDDPFSCGYWQVKNLLVEEDGGTKSDVLFSETFKESLGSFVVEGYNGDNNNIWSFEPNSKAAYADAYGKIGATEEITNYLVSPVITLSTEGNYASFDHYAFYFDDMNLRTKFCVREEAGEWVELVIPVFSLDNANTVNSGAIVIPEEFNGKKVQVAFKYNTPGSSSSGMWYINNLVVKAGVPAVKADPEISFDVTEVLYTLGEEMKYPVLNNPNNVDILYSSSDNAIAEVDLFSGAVTVYDEGTVVITATSVENENFISGTASYTLTITSSTTGIEAVTVEDLKNAEIYDLQGRRVSNPEKGIYVVNGKKYVIK